MYISPSVVFPNVQSLQSHRPLLRVCTVVSLCPCFSRCASDFRAFHCPLRRSDSSVGSGGPVWKLHRTDDDISELFTRALNSL